MCYTCIFVYLRNDGACLRKQLDKKNRRSEESGTMDELRLKVGLKEGIKKNKLRNTLQWASLVERMGDEQLETIADDQKVEGKGSDEVPTMRWDDGVKKDLERVG